MHVGNWSLIAFTILSQMSVGTFVVLGIVHFFARRKAGEEAADLLSDRALLAIGPVIILAFIASLFHLGSPFTAYRAVSNLGSSWLSREILSGILFALIGGLFAIMQWRKLGSVTLRTVIAWIAALIGLFFIFAMSNVYMMETVPTWNTWYTPVSFFTTAFLLGALAVATAYMASYAYLTRKQSEEASAQSAMLRTSLLWLAVTSIVLLGVQFVIIPSNLAYQYTGPLAAVITIRETLTQYGGVFLLRLILLFIGAGLLAVALIRNSLTPGRESTLAILAYSAFALVLIAEVLGRFLFYNSYVNIGL
jgi:anaerobic dimethyl sulfoxide reductase subunit C (anchor subunit)